MYIRYIVYGYNQPLFGGKQGNSGEESVGKVMRWKSFLQLFRP